MANAITFAEAANKPVKELTGRTRVRRVMTITTDSNYATGGITYAASAEVEKHIFGLAVVDEIRVVDPFITKSDLSGDWLQGLFNRTTLKFVLAGLPVNAANIPQAELANAYALGAGVFTCMVEAIGR